MVYTVQAESEPTPEFNAICRDILVRWQRNELPFADALQLMEAREREAVNAGHIANQARAHHLLGYLQHYRGNLDTSIQHYDRARLLFQRVNNLSRIATIDLNTGENYRLKGDFGRARRLYQSAYEIASQVENLPLQTMALLNEGLVLEAAGHLDRAKELLLQVYPLTERWTERREDLPGLRCELHNALASIYLRQGYLSDAWTEALRTLESATISQQPMYMGYALRALGEAVTRMEHVPTGQVSTDPDEHFRKAADYFKEMHMEAETARTLFAHARSLAHRGRRTMAARMLQQVMIMFTNLGMNDDAAKAAEVQRAVI